MDLFRRTETALRAVEGEPDIRILSKEVLAPWVIRYRELFAPYGETANSNRISWCRFAFLKFLEMGARVRP